jgi:glutamate dehydrogenase (NADP+)
LTGKDVKWGGSLIRPEATGFGVTYFAEEMLKTIDESLYDKVVAVSGFGNVAWGACQKVKELGGKVVTLSGPDGFIYDPDGITTPEKYDYMLEMRRSGRDRVQDYADKFGVEFYPGKRPWSVDVDVALPCATQNELDAGDAKELVKNGCKCLCEGANMPCTPEAIEIIQAGEILYGPGKAANAGGVATSGLEMSQNSLKMNWSRDEVDEKLHTIMINIHRRCVEAAEEYGCLGNYVNGANIAGFKKVADSMLEQGNV